MSAMKTTTTRRRFFLHGGAMLGAGVASAAGAAALTTGDPAIATKGSDEQLAQLQRELAAARDREAIRQLQLALLDAITSRRYGAAAALFTPDARLELSGVAAAGGEAIDRLFAEQYGRQEADCVHSGYRHDTRQQQDTIALDEAGEGATARFHVEAELSVPLAGDSTPVAMARQQGQMASSRWEAGHFDARFVKAQGAWKIASLEYVPA